MCRMWQAAATGTSTSTSIDMQGADVSTNVCIWDAFGSFSCQSAGSRQQPRPQQLRSWQPTAQPTTPAMFEGFYDGKSGADVAVALSDAKAKAMGSVPKFTRPLAGGGGQGSSKEAFCGCSSAELP